MDQDLAPPLPEPGLTHRLWSGLSRVWSRAPQAGGAEAELGYESAQPWALTETAPEGPAGGN